jgi:hypothetical protein
VSGLHRLLRSQLWLAALLLAAALALRLLVPAGFMPTVADGRITLMLCSGTQPVQPRAAMPGMAHHESDGASMAGSPCAYADLALPALGTGDAVLLVAALAFVMALAVRRIVPLPPRDAARLRPPLRGPPLPV